MSTGAERAQYIVQLTHNSKIARFSGGGFEPPNPPLGTPVDI